MPVACTSYLLLIANKHISLKIVLKKRFTYLKLTFLKFKGFLPVEVYIVVLYTYA